MQGARIRPDIVGDGWFATAGCAALLLATGLLSLRRDVARSRTARVAITIASTSAMGAQTLIGTLRPLIVENGIG